MKNQNSFHFLLILLIIAITTACSNDNYAPLEIETESCEVRLKSNSYINITNGNGDYTINVVNKDILNAEIDSDYEAGKTHIRISGKQKGETIITVIDNQTQKTAQIKVKVVDFYIALSIYQSNHPALAKNSIIYIVKNENQDCYFAKPENKTGKPIILTKGTYLLSVSLDNIILNYPTDQQGNFADISTTPIPHKFNIIERTQDIAEILQNAFLSKTKGNQPSKLKMEEMDTDYTVIAQLEMNIEMPKEQLK